MDTPPPKPTLAYADPLTAPGRVVRPDRTPLWALVAGLLSLAVPFAAAIIAVVFGSLVWNERGRYDRRQLWMSTIGIVLGLVSFVGWLTVAIVLF